MQFMVHSQKTLFHTNLGSIIDRTMNITFRKAVLHDLDILRSINFSSFEANAAYDTHIDMNWVHSDTATKYFTDAISGDDHFVLLALSDEVPAGYIILEPKVISYRTIKIIEIGIIAVLPEYRSTGIGSALITEAKIWATGRGYDTMFVNSYIRNEKAIEFYKKSGFSPIDISLELELK